MNEQMIVVSFSTGPGCQVSIEIDVKEGFTPERIADKMLRSVHSFLEVPEDE